MLPSAAEQAFGCNRLRLFARVGVFDKVFQTLVCCNFNNKLTFFIEHERKIKLPFSLVCVCNVLKDFFPEYM
jgi:hypothetical protein